ncbi:MAG: hypothetical protein NVS4B3_23110 [Gemmatimonadaceae bacterium]
MSDIAGLDVRLPIGGLFSVLGALLTGYGLVTTGDSARYVRSMSVNINLWWGLVMVVFGVALLAGAGRSARAARAAGREQG